MDFKNYKDQTFTTLPEQIIGSNFENCTFQAKSKFERCNIKNSKFEIEQEFYLSNITDCEGTENCIFTKSNNINSEEEELRHPRFREKE